MDEQFRLDRAWCYYCNLVHTVYREIRHAGVPTDSKAKLAVPDESYAAPMGQIQKQRATLKGTSLFDRIRSATSTARVRKPYEEVTGLTLEQVRALFSRDNWCRDYGGSKWARITDLTLRLGEALDAADTDATEAVYEEVRTVRHNFGPLVPTSDAEWNREKWPVRCD